MSELKKFLKSADLGIEVTSEGLHITVAAVDALLTGLEIFEAFPHAALIPPGAGVGTTIAVGAANLGGSVLVGVLPPAVGLTGVFLALGAPYKEAADLIHNNATASGFSQGFVAGILNMSAGTVKSIFGRHGVIHTNAAFPEGDVIETKAYNRGLAAGYAFANFATPEQKKAFVFEIRKFTGEVPVGNWGDREKRDYVIEYAAKLRLHFLEA